MIFTNLLDNTSNDFLPADKYVKRIDEYAEYYIETEFGVMFLTPAKLQKVTKGDEFGYYKNELGQIYENCYTNKYKELVKHYELFAKKDEQLVKHYKQFKTYEQLQFDI